MADQPNKDKVAKIEPDKGVEVKAPSTDSRDAFCAEAYPCPKAPVSSPGGYTAELLSPKRLPESMPPQTAKEVLRTERLMFDVLAHFDAEGVKTDARFAHLGQGRALLNNAYNAGLMQTIARMPESQLKRFFDEAKTANDGRSLDASILAQIPVLPPSAFATRQDMAGRTPSFKAESAAAQAEGEEARKIVMALASATPNSGDLTSAAIIGNDHGWPAVASLAYSKIPPQDQPEARERIFVHDTAKQVIAAATPGWVFGPSWDKVGAMLDGLPDNVRAQVNQEAKQISQGKSLEDLFQYRSFWGGDQTEQGMRYLRGDGGSSPYSVAKQALDTINDRYGMDGLTPGNGQNDSGRLRATRTLLSTLAVMDDKQLAQLNSAQAGTSPEVKSAPSIGELLARPHVPQATRDAARVLMAQGHDAHGDHAMDQIKALLKIGTENNRGDIVETALQFASESQRKALSSEAGADGKTQRDRTLAAFAGDTKQQTSIKDMFDYGEPSLLRLVDKNTGMMKGLSYETGVQDLIQHASPQWHQKYNDPGDPFRAQFDKVLDSGFSSSVATKFKAEMRGQETLTAGLLSIDKKGAKELPTNDLRRYVEANWDEKTFNYFKGNNPKAIDQLKHDLGTNFAQKEVDSLVNTVSTMSRASSFEQSRQAARPEWTQALKQVKGMDDLMSTLDEMPPEVRAKMADKGGDPQLKQSISQQVDAILAHGKTLLGSRSSTPGMVAVEEQTGSGDGARDLAMFHAANVYKKEFMDSLSSGSNPESYPKAVLARYAFGALNGDPIGAAPPVAVVKQIENLLSDKDLRERINGTRHPMSADDEEFRRVVDASIASALANAGVVPHTDGRGHVNVRPSPTDEIYRQLLSSGSVSPDNLLRLGKSDADKLDIICQYFSPEERGRLLSNGAGLPEDQARALNQYQQSVLGKGEHRRVFEEAIRNGVMTPVDHAYLDALYASKGELAQLAQAAPDSSASLDMLKSMPPELRELALKEAAAKGYTGLPALLSEVTTADQKLSQFDALSMRPRSEWETLFKANEQYDSRSASDLYSWMVGKVHSSVEARQAANDQTFQALLKEQAQAVAASSDGDGIERYKQIFSAAIDKYSAAQRTQDKSVDMIEKPVEVANFVLWTAATYGVGEAVAGSAMLANVSRGYRAAAGFMAVKVPSTGFFVSHMANRYAAYGSGGVSLGDWVTAFGYKLVQIKFGYLGAGSAILGH